ncbi:hypothetical protein BDV93DRAFT_513771 [Ceratobasidium sp. AG-I]|nr:hypothetical protein BDV93DRAFT_513771 [Ceratobasidium sp. AG-I]
MSPATISQYWISSWIDPERVQTLEGTQFAARTMTKRTLPSCGFAQLACYGTPTKKIVPAFEDWLSRGQRLHESADGGDKQHLSLARHWGPENGASLLHHISQSQTSDDVTLFVGA